MHEAMFSPPLVDLGVEIGFGGDYTTKSTSQDKLHSPCDCPSERESGRKRSLSFDVLKEESVSP